MTVEITEKKGDEPVVKEVSIKLPYSDLFAGSSDIAGAQISLQAQAVAHAELIADTVLRPPWELQHQANQ